MCQRVCARAACTATWGDTHTKHLRSHTRGARNHSNACRFTTNRRRVRVKFIHPHRRKSAIAYAWVSPRQQSTLLSSVTKRPAETLSLTMAIGDFSGKRHFNGRPLLAEYFYSTCTNVGRQGKEVLGHFDCKDEWVSSAAVVIRSAFVKCILTRFYRSSANKS